VPRAPSLSRDSRPSRITRKSYGPRVPNRTMVAKFDHVLLCWFRNGQASSPRSDENRWQGKLKPLRNHLAANRAAGAEARNIPAQSVWLESKKTSGRGEVFFLDPPLYRTYQDSLKTGRKVCNMLRTLRHRSKSFCSRGALVSSRSTNHFELRPSCYLTIFAIVRSFALIFRPARSAARGLTSK